jgi:hypothetical protein
MTDFPTTLYQCPGPHRGPRGTTFAFRPADDLEDILPGWWMTLEGAVAEYLGEDVPEAELKAQEALDAAEAATPDELKGMKKAELIAFADDLGIELESTKVADIRAEIAAAMAE